jgi:hypothetical protein
VAQNPVVALVTTETKRRARQDWRAFLYSKETKMEKNKNLTNAERRELRASANLEVMTSKDSRLIDLTIQESFDATIDRVMEMIVTLRENMSRYNPSRRKPR